MNIAKKYFQEQLINSEEFKHSYFEEKIKLDIEYQLEELKKDIQTRKTAEELIRKVDSIEQYVVAV